MQSNSPARPVTVRYGTPDYTRLVDTLHRPPFSMHGTLLAFAGNASPLMDRVAGEIAARLGQPLHRLERGSAPGRYIGETEKNLAALLDRAPAHGVLLLFDEADALFGRRSEVKDSHDRYANVETSYLLRSTREPAARDRATHAETSDLLSRLSTRRGVVIVRLKAPPPGAVRGWRGRQIVVRFPPF